MILSDNFYRWQALKIFVIKYDGINVSFYPMPKPKLPEEDKKDQVPLRLSKEAIAALDRIAQEWSGKRGKEVKRATVAREMLLIGLDTFIALRSYKIFAQFAQVDDAAVNQKAKLAEIAAVTDDLLSQSKDKNIDIELTEKAILRSLEAVRETLFNNDNVTLSSNTPTPAEIPDLRQPIRIENKIRSKGGRR